MEAFLAIEEWVVRMGASYWALACLLVFCIIDGLLPILPSETLIIALAALIPFGDGPNLILLIATGALGALVGDQFAFAVGRRFNVERTRFFQHGTGKRAADAARRGRFIPLTIISGPIWATYSALIGLLAGHVLEGHPLVSMLIGVAGGILLGFAMNWMIERFFSPKDAQDDAGGGGGEKRGDGPHRAGDASTPEGTGRQEAPVQA